MKVQCLLLAANFKDVKPIDDDVFEMRTDYGLGYCLCHALIRSELALHLAGGHKSLQEKDIEKVKKLNQERMIGTKMKKAAKWDASVWIETEANIAAYLNAALEDGDILFLLLSWVISHA